MPGQAQDWFERNKPTQDTPARRNWVEAPASQYLSRDPNAGYLSTDPKAGTPIPRRSWFDENAPPNAAQDPFAPYVVDNSQDDPFAPYVVQRSASRRPVSAEDFVEKGPEGSAISRFAANAGEMLNPIAAIKSVGTAVLHPQDAAKAIFDASADQFDQARQMYSQGRYSEAVGHLGGMIPIIGPAAAAAGEQIGEGDIAGGLGKGVGLIAPMLVGAAVPKSAKMPAVARNADALSAEAVEFGIQKGVPIDAATATGNRFVKTLQHVSDRSLGGSLVAGRAAQRQAEGLATIGERLAERAHPAKVGASEAGAVAQRGVNSVVKEQRIAADDAYDTLRAIEAIRDPMPVSLAQVKTAIQPVADRLAQKKAVTGALMGKEATAAAKIEALLSGPDAVPLSVADAALSDLKQLARSNHPDLRTVGQGAAARVVTELHRAVDAAAAAGGPDAVAALNAGRVATQAKYGAAAVLRKLEGADRSKSPAAAFRNLTSADDLGAKTLRDVLTQTPKAKPVIGRAVLDRLIDHPTAGAAKTYADWERLGPDTKRLLFDADHVKDLDRFFRLRKMMAENPNPSGTAQTMLAAGQGGLILTNPLSGIAVQFGGAALSTLLHSKAGAKLLTRGLTIPVRNKAAGSAWLTELANATSPSELRTSPAGAR